MKKRKTTKHRFTHIDPERTPSDTVNTVDKKTQKKTIPNDEYGYIKEDLKRSVILITIFIFFLIIFYLLNNQYSFIDLFKNTIKI